MTDKKNPYDFLNLWRPHGQPELGLDGKPIQTHEVIRKDGFLPRLRSIQPQPSPDQQPIDVEFPLVLSASRDGARLLLNELVAVEREVEAHGVYGSYSRGRIEACSQICKRLFNRIGKLQDMLRSNAERKCREDRNPQSNTRTVNEISPGVFEETTFP